MEKLDIKDWHAHLYYPIEKAPEVVPITQKVTSQFNYPVGTIWDKPVGPHPIGSCQITVPSGELDRFIPWLMLNREFCDVFLHPNTGSDLEDHRDHALWLGKSYKLNLDTFK
jgi:DOPA 4,5-dioxygenase